VIFFVCSSLTCNAVIRVAASDLEQLELTIGSRSDWFPDRYPCPICGELMALHTRCPEERTQLIDLSPGEAFAAFCGAGLPAEQECSATRVRELLTTMRVVRVQTRHITGTNRCTLDTIELDGGVVLHLASSAHGACVYRIRAPAAFTESLEHGHHGHHVAPST
jgi:hypothetical protein